MILPAGPVEQHGPHLPAGTDTLAANVIAHAVAERMDGLVLPATPLGVTPMHMPFEGTITLTPDTYMRVVTETCGSTARHGARYLLILNWHEGNIPSLAIAAEALHREHGMTVLTVQAYVAEELYGQAATASPTAARSRRWRCSPIGPIWCISTASTIRPTTGTATRWTSCAGPQLSAGADRHPLDRADRLVRQPAARHRREGRPHARRHRRRDRQGGNRNLPQLDAVQGGTAEVKRLRQVK